MPTMIYMHVSVQFKYVYILTIQLPKTNEAVFQLGAEFVGADLVVILFRGRVC